MSIHFRIAAMLLPLAAAALAEPRGGPENHSGQGYIFYGAAFAPEDFEAQNMFGAGGEALVYEGLGLGGELGYTFPQNGFEYGFGLASANASYHFVGRAGTQRFAPFLTGGYSVAFRDGALNLINYGAGANVWFSERAGVRFEIRNYQHPRWGQFQLALRLGLTFR
jgi:hypothetical protein